MIIIIIIMIIITTIIQALQRNPEHGGRYQAARPRPEAAHQGG